MSYNYIESIGNIHQYHNLDGEGRVLEIVFIEANTKEEALSSLNNSPAYEEGLNEARSAKYNELTNAIRSYESIPVSRTINSKYLEFLPDRETEVYLKGIKEELKARYDDGEDALANLTIDVYTNGSDTPVNVSGREFIKIYKNFMAKRNQVANYVKGKRIEIKNATTLTAINSITIAGAV